MGKLNFYAVVFCSCLAWSAAFIIGGTLVAPGTMFTTMVVGFLAVAALMLPLGSKNLKNLMDEEVLQSGVLLGVLAGALGLGCLLGALKYISPVWVLGACLAAPIISSVIGGREMTGFKALALVLAYMGLVTMTGAAELGAGQVAGLTLSGLGALTLGLGLSHYRVKGQGRSSLGLAFWAAIGAGLFLIPAALHETAGLMSWSWGQFISAVGLALALLIGFAGWAWLVKNHKRGETDSLVLAATPMLGLIFLVVTGGLEAGMVEIVGMLMLGLALGLTGKKDNRPAVQSQRPIEFARPTLQPAEEHRQVA